MKISRIALYTSALYTSKNRSEVNARHFKEFGSMRSAHALVTGDSILWLSPYNITVASFITCLSTSFRFFSNLSAVFFRLDEYKVIMMMKANLFSV